MKSIELKYGAIIQMVFYRECDVPHKEKNRLANVQTNLINN